MKFLFIRAKKLFRSPSVKYSKIHAEMYILKCAKHYLLIAFSFELFIGDTSLKFFQRETLIIVRLNEVQGVSRLANRFDQCNFSTIVSWISIILIAISIALTLVSVHSLSFFFAFLSSSAFLFVAVILLFGSHTNSRVYVH